MMFLSLGTLIQPVLQPQQRPTLAADLWASCDVCIQIHPAKCSSAAGATLLAAHGIVVTEARMVELYLNDSWGTPSLGLWCALCIATTGTAFRPQVVNVNVDDLLTKGPWIGRETWSQNNLRVLWRGEAITLVK